jgi:hypothetical protein
MKRIIFIFSITLILSSCKDNIIENTLDFSGMEIHYSVSGGWIHSYSLDINNQGLVFAKGYSYTKIAYIDSAVTILGIEDRTKLACLFENFSKYKRHYEPEEFWTDQNYYSIILNYHGRSDTVSVYNLTMVSIPSSLKKIIEYLELLHKKIIDDYANVSSFNGYWEAVTGDSLITSGPGILVYNWYALDATIPGDSIKVTWDNGITCSSKNTELLYKDIHFTAEGVKANFYLVGSKEIWTVFIWNEKQYNKTLRKIRNDPGVLCD